MQPARLLLLVLAAVAAMLLLSAPAPADAARPLRGLLQQQFPAGGGLPWSGPAYANAGRGTFSYSGLVGMPGSPSVIRPPGFFVTGSRFWGR